MHKYFFPLLILLSACDKTIEPGQVVANVNGTEISVHQFNHVLKLAGPAAGSKIVRKELASKLIDRELAIQQAIALKLDRNPEIMFKLEEAKRDVLAKAYAEQIVSGVPKPTETDAARYFSEHPELFKERKIFRLHEITLPVEMNQLGQAKELISKGKSMDEILSWLRQEKVEFSSQFVIRAAEQLPIQTLAKLNKTVEGGTAFFESPRGVVLYQVLAAQQSPVGLTQAIPIILDYLERTDGKQAMDSEMENLRSAAHIDYLGEFSSLLKPNPTKAL